jgi:hypothetical protein
MIDSLKSLQSKLLLEGELENNPVFKREYMMKSPGCLYEKIIFLKESIPELPQSYINILGLYWVNNIVIDSFDISVRSYDNDNPVDGILDAHQDPFFPKEFMAKHNMYQIGSYETDLICITSGTNTFHHGEILYVDEGFDIYDPQDEQIHPLAKDFEEFLIIAGNLDEVHTEVGSNDSNYEEKKAEFLARLKDLGVDEKYYPTWLRVF